MKARINYKSKKTIIIIAIAVVLLIAAITGTVAYIKGNNNAAAAMENTEVTEPANNGNDSNNNGGVKNPNTPNTDNPEQIPIIDDNQNPTTPAQNGDTTTNPETTTNQGTTTGTTTGNAGTTVPDTEYTQTTVVENPWKTEDITWAPISLQAITANNGLEICVPSFSIEKSSEIVKYSENKSDKAEVGDTIKYTITVTNTGKVTLKDIEVRDDMVGVSTTIKTLEVGRNEKILAEHVVSEEDIIKSLDNDGIITNIATAIYRNEEKETENTVEAKNEYNYIVNYYKDSKEEGNFLGKIEDTAEFGETITASTTEYKPEGYKFEGTAPSMVIKVSGNVIDVIYVKDIFGYTINYYRDSKSEENFLGKIEDTAEFGATITASITEYKPEGYKFEGTAPSMVIKVSGNVIDVIYVKDIFGYTINYYQDSKEEGNFLGKIEDTAEFGATITASITEYKPEGYKFEGTAPSMVIKVSGNVIDVIYVKDIFGYTINYYQDSKEEGNFLGKIEDTAEFGATITASITEYKPEGYKFNGTAPSMVIKVSGNVIDVIYVKDNFDYIINYYRDSKSEENFLGKIEDTAEFGTTITASITEYKPAGYKFEGTAPSMVIKVSGNVIDVIYVKDIFGYTINYYQDSKSEENFLGKIENTAEFGATITASITEYKPEGYKFNGTAPSMVIKVSGNVIDVIYTKRTDLTYTVNYYYNGTKEISVPFSNQTYLAAISYVDAKATYNDVTYEEYDRTTSNGTMPLIIGLGTNYINVYYGTPNVTINKVVDSTTANAGSELNYTITVSEDRGFVNAKNIKVTDNLPSELEVIADSITSDGKLNDAKTEIEWNIAELEKGKDVELKFTAKIKPNTIGKVITNNVTLTDATGNTIGSDSATTTVNGKTVEVREITKGREADDVNIIFIMDNSSSMNEPIANTSYLNDDSYYVAPSDEQKTRLNSAKTATKEFINKIYADKNLKNTNMSVITFNNNESDQEDTADVIGKGPYTSDKVKEESHLFYTKYYVVENNKKIYVEQATDRNYYEIKDTTIKSGANVVGSATSSDYSELVTKVDGITIGCRREGFGTYINPALKQAKTIIEGYKNNEATKANRNIVIVLCDGDINGKYADSLNDLKGDKDKAGLADEIYCIGFGKDAANPKKNAYKTLANMTTVYEKDKSGKLVKKVYTAENTETLIQEFTSILENMNDKKNYITGVSDIVSDIKCGEIAIKASDILEMPLVVYNNDTEVINCASKEELANYGMSYDESNQIIRWDINECIEKNPTIDLSGTLKLRYYIPLN